MNPISVIVNVHNEEEYLEEAFGLLAPYVDDFVVVDQGSTDRTVEIARKFTNKILLFPRVYYSYAYIHQAALLANHEWVFKPDPDERYDTELLEKLGEYISWDNYSDILAFRMIYGGDDLSSCPRLWRKSRVIWTDSFDAVAYNAENLVVRHIDDGVRIRNLRTRESAGERYRIEGAKRLLARYGDTEVEPYKNYCAYYREIAAENKV